MISQYCGVEKHRGELRNTGGEENNTTAKKNKNTYISQHEHHLINCRPRALLEQAVLVWNSRLYVLFPLLAELRKFWVAHWVAILPDPSGHASVNGFCVMFDIWTILLNILALGSERFRCDGEGFGTEKEFFDAEDLQKKQTIIN